MIFFFSVLLLIIDQLLKEWAIKTPFFVINSGYIFGRNQQFLFLFFNAILVLILVVLAIKEKKREFDFAFALLLAGAVSNLIDRILRGGVIDFLQLSFFNIKLDFNLSDMLILVGVIIYGFKKTNQN